MRSILPDWEIELARWLKPFLEQLGHKARRRMCPLYVAGLIGPGDRKSVQPMAERLAPGDYDQLHHFVAAGVWDAAPLEKELLVQADKLVGGSDAVLVIDDTAVPKKGKHSVGVAWQYASALGKNANCQTLVSLTLARDEVPVMVALRLFLPESWTSDLARLKRAGVAVEYRTARTKPEIALAAAGGGPQNLVKTIEYVTPAALECYRGVADVRSKLLREPWPASTGLVCEALLRPQMLIEVHQFSTETMALLNEELKAWIGRETHYPPREELGRASIRYFALAIGDNTNVAALPAYFCQRRIATSTYRGSNSRARALRPVRSAAIKMVPLPQNGSSTRPPRREQSLIASAIRRRSARTPVHAGCDRRCPCQHWSWSRRRDF